MVDLSILRNVQFYCEDILHPYPKFEFINFTSSTSPVQYVVSKFLLVTTTKDYQ